MTVSTDAAGFRNDLETGGLTWTPGNYALYGYDVNAYQPSTDMIMELKAPGDRPALTRLVRRAMQDGQGYLFEHRILPRTGDPIPVVVAVDVVHDDQRVVRLDGITVDLRDRELAHSADIGEDVQERLRNLTVALDTRDVIGQAKGILMERLHIDSERAFQCLVVASQHRNEKVRVVAEELATTGRLPDIDPGVLLPIIRPDLNR